MEDQCQKLDCGVKKNPTPITKFPCIQYNPHEAFKSYFSVSEGLLVTIPCVCPYTCPKSSRTQHKHERHKWTKRKDRICLTVHQTLSSDMTKAIIRQKQKYVIKIIV